jgi:hypothetical protein
MVDCNRGPFLGSPKKTKGDFLALRHLSMAFRVFSTVLVYATALDSAYAFAPAHRVRIPHGNTRMDSNIRMVATAMPIQVLPLVTDNNYDEGEQT